MDNPEKLTTYGTQDEDSTLPYSETSHRLVLCICANKISNF